MSDIIYSAKLIPTDSKNKYQRYFAIPVSIIKVLLIKGEKAELNHFERAILSLLLNKYHTINELSDKLCLNNDLVELILNDLKNKELIDEYYKVSQKGEDALKGIYQDKKQENCYLLYDYNRECLINNTCNDNDIVFSQSFSNENGYSFKFENDAFSEDISYKYINLNKNLTFDKRKIEQLIKRDLFRKNDEQNLIKFEVIESNNKIYHLLSSIETNLEDNKKWYVKNPISFEPDLSLYNFIYNNSSNKDINALLNDIMEKKRNKLNNDNTLYDQIKNNIFYKPISVEHEEFIIPLIGIVKSLTKSNDKNISDRVYHNEVLAESMVLLGDLFEKVLYQAAFKYHDLYTEIDLLHKTDNRQNSEVLEGIAKSIGFDISNTSYKLLLTNRRSMKKILDNPNAAQLSECVSLNLILARNNRDHFYYKLADKYSGFINLMYEFKRIFRDKTKHTVELDDTVSLRKYIDILFDLLDLSLGYKFNKDTLNKLINSNETVYDYSYSEELLRLKVGNKLLESNNVKMNEIKFNLISLIDDYITKNAKYLRKAYALLEEYTKLILNSFISNNRIIYIPLSKKFESKDELKHYLESLGFIMDSKNTIGNEVIDSLDFKGKEDYIERSFISGFNNAVLGVKTLALIVIFLNNKELAKTFIDNDMNDFFVITSNVSYIQRHSQVHVYNENDAKTIVDGVIKMTDFIINKMNIVK